MLVLYPPTASQLVVLKHATPLSEAEVDPLGFGLGTVDQVVPFQCSTSVMFPPPLYAEPTALQLVALGHETLESPEFPIEFGLATMDQPVPFQCSASVLTAPVLLTDFPTALQLVALEQATPDSRLSLAPVALGLVIVDHVVPFHRTTRVFSAASVFVK
jgi:hypothetical protein